MNAVTFQLSDEMFAKIKFAADASEQSIDKFVANVMEDACRHFEAEERFRQRAARGKGREKEALELLRR